MTIMSKNVTQLLLFYTLLNIYTLWVKKGRHYTLVHTFDKYWPIFTVLSPTYSVGNLQ